MSPTGSRKKSPIWLYFESVDIEKAKCNICHNVYSYKSRSTSNLKKHLRTKHPTVNIGDTETEEDGQHTVSSPQSTEENDDSGCTVISKWNNIRDAFSRSLKHKNEDGTPKRKYIYHDNLSFLAKIVDKDIEHNLSRRSADKTLDNENENFDVILNNARKKMKKEESEVETKYERTEKRMMKPLFEKSDEDELFFASILPAVRKFSDEEKFDFRIGVMKLVQDIRKRKPTKQELLENSFGIQICIPEDAEEEEPS